MTNNRIMQRLAQDPAIASLFASFEQSNREREVAAAKADPMKHKLTRVFEAGVSANYRYYSTKNGKKQEVRFCYSVHRNAAGFYLGWRETWMRNGTVKRDMWLSRRVRNRCADIALERRAALESRVQR